MNYIYSILFLLLAGGRVSSQEVSSFSLQQCVDYALENNQTIKNAAYEVEISETQVKETTGLGLPQVNISSGINYNYDIQQVLLPPFDNPEGEEIPLAFGQTYDGNIALTARQLLFEGAYFVGLQAARAVRELSSKKHVSTQIDVAEAVSKAYYNVLVTKERYDLLKVNLGRTDSLLYDTRALYENGFAEKIDVNRVKVQHNNLKVQVSSVQKLLSLSYDLLKFQMGMSLSDSIYLTDKLGEVDFAVIERDDLAYQDRIEYSELQSNLTLVNLDMKRNKSLYLPSLYANFNYGYNTNAGESSQIFEGDRWLSFGALGLSLNIPVFDGLIKSAKIQRNKLQEQQIEQAMGLLKNSIDLEVRQAEVTLSSAIDDMVAQKENMALAEEIYTVSKIKYEEGVGTNLEVTNADADYKVAQTNYYDALYAALVAKIDLEKAYGILIK